MNTLRRVLAFSVATLGLSFATQSFAQTFTYTQIDVPNSSLTRPFGINSFGQIVGLSRDGDGTPHGFLRDTDGTYLKFGYPGAIFTNATSINDQGQIVGRWIDPKGYNHTYLRSPSGVFSNFDPPAPCFPGLADNRGIPAPAPYKPTLAHGINNNGDRVGRCFSHKGHEYGWILYNDGIFQILTGPNFDASDAWFAPTGGQYIAGGDYGVGAAQSCYGPGLGYLHINGTCFVHGVLWDRNGDPTTLDAHNSQTGLRAMNSSGDVTGIYYDEALARQHGFLLRNGVVTDIDFPNSSDSGDTFINDNGLIIGAFIDVAGVEHGFIATCSGNGC
jgi:probable HAF family extracellular repeat protein